LGTNFSKAEKLLEFLNSIQPEQIILVGDIIDVWGLKHAWHWSQSHSKVIQKFIKLSGQGVRIIFIPGNHDEFFREYVNLNFGQIEIRDRIEYRTQTGKRLLVVHGDEYDIFMQDSYRWLAHLGDRAFHVIQFFSQLDQKVRALVGREYWSLAGYVKGRTKSISKIIGRFENALLMAARREGFDGVICGHIHHAEIKQVDDLIYMNCGDWVDSCTALVEDHAGKFRIIDWMKTSQARQALVKKRSGKAAKGQAAKRNQVHV
jgi:UDP-2,3-diacylglucosamine pyrophosphatase LpxH